MSPGSVIGVPTADNLLRLTWYIHRGKHSNNRNIKLGVMRWHMPLTLALRRQVPVDPCELETSRVYIVSPRMGHVERCSIKPKTNRNRV